MIDWRSFVIAHGWKAHAYELAAVVERPVEEILRFRTSRTCTRLKKAKPFAVLFALRHGRPPRDDEWPKPRRSHRGSYNWQAPELALLASLVGRLGKAEASRILTKRLRKLTGDRRASRSLHAVQMAINHRLGMVTSDVIGGLTIAEAGREAGSRAIIYHLIRRKVIKPFRVGRLWVIPREAWEAWKKTRVFPPKGYVQLASIRKWLGIKSDAKLPSWAELGYIPTAVLCNPYGLGERLHNRGAWYVDAKVARKIVADRRAGRPMPWHGRPDPGNLAVTWRRLQARAHPLECQTCRQIWGRAGAPKSYDDYLLRYPPLNLGAKRHLTRVFSPGMTAAEVARFCATNPSRVVRAIELGVLSHWRYRGRIYVTRTDATHWKARKCPTGSAEKSWVSIALASRLYLFSARQLRRFIAEKKLKAKVGTFGAQRGITYVSKHMVGQLRQRRGFSEKEAARRVGVTIDKLRILLRGMEWRGGPGIPLYTVRALQQRLESREGYTIEAAAAKLDRAPEWVRDRIMDGTIRVSRTKWDRRRLYISEPQFQRLREAKRRPVKHKAFGKDWLLQSPAAVEAGVSNTTIIHWAEADELRRRQSHLGWRYNRRSVRARARLYWKTVRLRRAIPPDWLLKEIHGAGSSTKFPEGALTVSRRSGCTGGPAPSCDERQKYGDHGLRRPSVAGRAGSTHAKEPLARPHASKTLTARASTPRCRKSARVLTGRADASL